MNLRTYENLKKHLGKPLSLRKSTTKVVTYRSANPSLKIKGMINVLAEIEEKKSEHKILCGRCSITDDSNIFSLMANLCNI